MKTGQGKTWSEDDARRKAVATAITALVSNDRKLIDSITAERDSLRAERDKAVELLRSGMEEGSRCAAWCCGLAGDKTYDAVRCFNEVYDDSRAFLSRLDAKGR